MTGGKLSVAAAMPLALAIAQGLSELHSLCIIVCDLKPPNILLTFSGHAVIADFGIARVLGTHVLCVRPTNVQGTANYMAPEQMLGEREGEVTYKTDTWGFACTVLHMLTGKEPLHGSNNCQIMNKVSFSRLAWGFLKVLVGAHQQNTL